MSEIKNEFVEIPVLPLKDVFVFPNMIVPVYVGRKNSVKVIEIAKAKDVPIFIVTQKSPDQEDIVSAKDLYSYGLVARIKEVMAFSDNSIRVTLETMYRAKLESLAESASSGWVGEISLFSEPKLIEDLNRRLAFHNNLKEEFANYMKIIRSSDDFLENLGNLSSDSFQICYHIASRLELVNETKDKILSINEEEELLNFLLSELTSSLNVFSLQKKLKNRIRVQIEKNQKDYYLNEQMKAIQKELGDFDDSKEDFKALEKKIKNIKLTEHARETVLTELKKLKHMNNLSAEFSIIKNYIDFLLDLPWGVYTKTNKDLDLIKSTLDKTHFGMFDIKERIYELIMQKNRVKTDSKSTILCFYGAPGIGKTTLAYSIGAAMGLKTISIPLGGVRDEAILRGHRRTYIGSMPGKIIQALKDAKSSNLVIVLDEIGSIGSDWRGNPEDVLLEVLDTMQNKSFQDNYLGTGFDLSGVIFVATTNSIDTIKPALLDRLEIIYLSGYTQDEKVRIAKDYIIPNLLTEYGLIKDQIEISEDLLNEIIRYYTYESGVRGLEKQLSKVIRKIMREIEEDKVDKVVLTKAKLQKFLKKPVYFAEEFDKFPKKGVVNGLAYVKSREGQEGEILKIESALVPGDGKIEFTGNLGDMMKESVQIAFKALLSNLDLYKIDSEILKNKNIYINFPSCGTPKDGPSAGIAIFCSIFSTLKDVQFPNDIALTGEISLYNVLKVGGIKEKLLAAYRNGIKKVFIPHDNIIDLIDVSEEIKKAIEIIGIKTVNDLLSNIGLI